MARLNHLTDRGLETQDVFICTFLELVLEKGYESVTVKEITERTGLDRTTFYLHFKSKAELLERCQTQFVQELVDESLESDRGAIVHRLFQKVAEKRLLFQTLLRIEMAATAERRLFEVAVSRLIEGPGLDLLAPSGLVNREIAAQFAAATARMMVLWWVENDAPCSPDAAAEICLGLLAKGLESLSP